MRPVTARKVEQKHQEVVALDKVTQEIIDRIHRNDRRFRIWGTICFLVLFGVGVVGIFYQNKLAAENKQHIDCIVKLFATHASPGQTRRIADLDSCKIQVGP